MFYREAYKPKPGELVSYEVRYPRGRKPFDALAQAEAFAKDQRAAEGGWAEISRVVKTVVSKK